MNLIHIVSEKEGLKPLTPFVSNELYVESGIVNTFFRDGKCVSGVMNPEGEIGIPSGVPLIIELHEDQVLDGCLSNNGIIIANNYTLRTPIAIENLGTYPREDLADYIPRLMWGAQPEMLGCSDTGVIQIIYDFKYEHLSIPCPEKLVDMHDEKIAKHLEIQKLRRAGKPYDHLL